MGLHKHAVSRWSHKHSCFRKKGKYGKVMKFIINVREEIVQEITVVQWSKARMGLEYHEVKSHFSHECSFLCGEAA
jgi:hypothetical protein